MTAQAQSLSLNRRSFLQASAAVVATAVAAIPAATAASASMPPLHVWTVGTAGEYDWFPVHAATEAEARAEWLSENGFGGICEIVEAGAAANAECDCDYCRKASGLDVGRVEQWDGRPLDQITPADWLTIGMGHTCSRCGYETHEDCGGRAIGKEAVCEECMTPQDWDIVDPDRARELRIDEDRDEHTPARQVNAPALTESTGLPGPPAPESRKK